MSRMRPALHGLLGGLLLLAGVAHAGTRHYYYTDPQGTVLAKADAQGNIIATYDYAPYGSQALGTAPNGPGYTGHVNDPDTGLVYMQARYYDPAVGRFLSTDPVGPTPGNTFNFNRYDYANDNPGRYIDPDGRTCTEVNKTYTCQIDKVITQQNSKLVTRNATAEDHKTYAGLEKALTKAVNAAAGSGKAVGISFKSGGATYSFSIAGTSVAQNLAGRVIRVDPFDPSNSKDNWAMITSHNTTTVGKYGLQPGRTVFGDAERTQEEEFLHEGIHQSSEERKALGFFGQIRMGHDQNAHQDAYNDAANSFLGPNQ